MSDLLSSSSLLMAVLAMLFSLWYNEIILLINKEGEKHAEDNIKLVKKIKATIIGKLLILLVLSISASSIFLPDAVKIISEAWTLRLSDTSTYSAVKSAFILVSATCICLTFIVATLTLKMICKYYRLKK